MAESFSRESKARTAERRWMRNPVGPSSCVTLAGTSNEPDVQNEWEENTHTHTHYTVTLYSYMLEESSFLGEGALEVVGSLVSAVWSSSPYINVNRVFTRLYYMMHPWFLRETTAAGKVDWTIRSLARVKAQKHAIIS